MKMKKRYAIGIDLGGTNTKVALVGRQGKLISKKSFSTAGCKSKDSLINAIVSSVSDILNENKLKPKAVLGLGIGVPGLVDSENGIVHFLTNIPGWKNVNLKNILRSRLNMSVYVDNDVNLMALAEAKFGAAKGACQVFCITLGTGVGGGIVIDGKVYRGNTQSAGEIGHVSIDPDGPVCNCGRRGCLEAFVGNKYIADRFNKMAPELITEAAKKGDLSAIKAWEEIAEYLGRGLVFIVNVFNPAVIVIGGGIADAGYYLFKPLVKYVRENALSVPAKAVKIVKAKLGNDAGVIGAAELAR